MSEITKGLDFTIKQKKRELDDIVKKLDNVPNYILNLQGEKRELEVQIQELEKQRSESGIEPRADHDFAIGNQGAGAGAMNSGNQGPGAGAMNSGNQGPGAGAMNSGNQGPGAGAGAMNSGNQGPGAGAGAMNSGNQGPGAGVGAMNSGNQGPGAVILNASKVSYPIEDLLSESSNADVDLSDVNLELFPPSDLNAVPQADL